MRVQLLDLELGGRFLGRPFVLCLGCLLELVAVGIITLGWVELSVLSCVGNLTSSGAGFFGKNFGHVFWFDFELGWGCSLENGVCSFSLVLHAFKFSKKFIRFFANPWFDFGVKLLSWLGGVDFRRKCFFGLGFTWSLVCW